jgi:hypothetical protein
VDYFRAFNHFFTGYTIHINIEIFVQIAVRPKSQGMEFACFRHIFSNPSAVRLECYSQIIKQCSKEVLAGSRGSAFQNISEDGIFVPDSEAGRFNGFHYASLPMIIAGSMD